MDQYHKLSLLSENMDFEEGESINTFPKEKSQAGKQPVITHAKLPNGKSIPLLKSMISSVCEKNCNYCAFRSGRDCERATFTPDEMAHTFAQLNHQNIAKGLFLSSGIAGGGSRVQDKIIDTAAILRTKLNYQGYMHLKIMPGAEYDQVKKMMQYADRVSINLEAPNQKRLATLAPKKDFFNELHQRLLWAVEIRKNLLADQQRTVKVPSITTQFVVGPSGESDVELLKTSIYLLKNYQLARIYFMTFSPVVGTPMENLSREDPMRGHRLYQSSFLMRDYGFQFDDFVFQEDGNLQLDKDPKQTWADQHLSDNPIEINKASTSELLRIPGIGPKRVKIISDYRRKNLICNDYELRILGIPIEKAGKYLLLNGKKTIHQLSLFPI